MRQHWREREYWLWLWHHHVPSEAKVGLGALVAVLLLGGGWFAADRLTTAHASVADLEDVVLETTVQRVVTVRERGKVVRRVIPVVKKVYLHPSTAFETKLRYATRVVTAPGSVRIVPSVSTVHQVVTALRPVVKRQVVTVNGQAHTVVRTRMVPTTRVATVVRTQNRVLTNRQTVTRDVAGPGVTVTQARTATVPVTVTQAKTATETQARTATVTQARTATVTQARTATVPVTVTHAQTVTQTQTQTQTETETETQTVTQVQTQTQTETQTVTETQTETVTVEVPPVTITITDKH